MCHGLWDVKYSSCRCGSSWPWGGSCPQMRAHVPGCARCGRRCPCADCIKASSLRCPSVSFSACHSLLQPRLVLNSHPGLLFVWLVHFTVNLLLHCKHLRGTFLRVVLLDGARVEFCFVIQPESFSLISEFRPFTFLDLAHVFGLTSVIDSVVLFVFIVSLGFCHLCFLGCVLCNHFIFLFFSSSFFLCFPLLVWPPHPFRHHLLRPCLLYFPHNPYNPLMFIIYTMFFLSVSSPLV